MTPDELGEKGESKFKELCADAGLICNKSDRDRAGWDFVVDFPIDDYSGKSYDNRLPPLSCVVQQKTILNSSKNIKIKLSMAERLAKEIKPSFISVFKVDQNRQFTDAFLIHISGDRLKAILKKLREEQVKNDGISLNHKFISFTPSQNERIDISGEALKERLQSICGDDLHEYSNNKKIQLQELGFEGNRYFGKFKLKVTDEADFLDVMSGKKDALVEDFETVENRFGITIPADKFKMGTVKITPNSVGKCVLSFRKNELDKPIVFHCDLLTTPKFDGESPRRFIIKHKLFSFHKDFATQVPEDAYFFLTEIDDHKCTANEWTELWEMLSILTNGDGIIEVKSEDSILPQTLELLPLDLDDDSSFLDINQSWNMSKSLSKIIAKTDIFPSPIFTFEDIYDNAMTIFILSKLIDGAIPRLHKGLEPYQLDNEKKYPVIFTGYLDIGSNLIGFYATSLITINETDEISVDEFKLRKIQNCINKDGFIAFIEHAKKKHQVTNVRYIQTPHVQEHVYENLDWEN